jgi:hypothetical protein
VISLFAVPPEIQTVFDGLRAILASNPDFTNVNAYASVDATGNNVGVNITDKYGSSKQYSERATTGKVFLDPMSATAGPGATVQFAATTLDATGTAVPATVTWTLQAGALGTVSATGLYTAPATITGPAADYVTAKDAANASATASIQLHV